MLIIASFLPFDERGVNGSTTVAARVVEQLLAKGVDVKHVMLETAWKSLDDLAEQFEGATAVIGIGEGFDHYVTVEQFCFRRASGKDVDDQLPGSTDSWPGNPEEETIEGSLLWDASWISAEVLYRLGLSSPRPVIEGTFTGYYLCNALMYHLYALGFGACFCHLPPQGAWMERTERSADDYANSFAAIIHAVIVGNELLPRVE